MARDTVELEHPRAAMGKTPPDRVGYGRRAHASVGDDGYFEVPEKYSEHVRQALARRYGVEYDGTDVVLDESDDSEDDESDNSEDDESPDETVADFDLEEFLDENYRDRVDAVESGEVDDHLDDIKEADTSKKVLEAIESRREGLAEE